VTKKLLLKPALAGLVLLTLGLLSFRQSGIYRDMETLWRATISRNPASAMAHNNLGMLLVQTERLNEAMYYLQRAVALNPNNAEAHNNLGNAWRAKGRLDQALDEFRKAVELRPNVGIYHANVGGVLATKGNFREAVAQFETALQNAPDNPFIANNLAWLLATCADGSVRNGARSLEIAQNAVKLSNDDARVIATLSAAYAEAGKLDEAILTAEKARQLALQQGNRALADFSSRLVDSFRAGNPFHEN
jgi:protein O-mannosyl-transferase